MTSPLPKISVVTPSYNCGHLILRCILSVLDQDYPAFEHIVVDGASSDGTCDTLRSFQHLRWISEPDSGEANAVNKALAMTTGDIVCWLNADDFLYPGVFKKIAALFLQNPNVEAVYGDAEFRRPDGFSYGLKRPRSGLIFRDFLRWWHDDMLPHQPSMFFSRELLTRVGPLNESLHFSIDLELWIRCALETKLYHVPETLSVATHRDDCKSHNTVPQQIMSHWGVVIPFLSHLSFDERVEFWCEYYAGRLNGSMRFVQFDPCRFPDTEEALVALVRVLSYSIEPKNTLQELFWAPQSQRALIDLLGTHGLTFDTGFIAAHSEVVAVRRSHRLEPTVVLDGVFFQYRRTGICRMWTEVLKEWAASEFAGHIVVLDRGGTAPRFPGIQYRLVQPQNFSCFEQETVMLEEICRAEAAALFISTYFTSVSNLPTVVPIYDMILEKLGLRFDGALDEMQAKIEAATLRAMHKAVERGSAFACMSENTKRDLLEIYPEVSSKITEVTLCGVSRESFSPASPQEIATFRSRLGITQLYFVLVGGGADYKNTRMLFEAIQMLSTEATYAVINTGGPYSAERLGVGDAKCKVISASFSDADLRLIYAGASALVYPSLYEGFGLPILEAMSCGCPVITTSSSSTPEVAGEAALYANTPEALANALIEVQKPAAREALIHSGYERATQFSWATTALQIRQLCQAVLATSTQRLSAACASDSSKISH